jgi:DNA-binding transcriptional LysR family regulator
LIARFERQAPALSLHIAQPAGDNARLIEQGGADLALGIFSYPSRQPPSPWLIRR